MVVISVATNVKERKKFNVIKTGSFLRGKPDMENWQKAYIKEKKRDLVCETVCSVTLLAKLESVGLIGEHDTSIIKAGDSDIEKTTRLYEILVQVNSYDLLLRSLISERQMAAAAILQRGIERQRINGAMVGAQGAGNIENGDSELLIPPTSSKVSLKYRNTIILMGTLLIIAVIISSVAVSFIFVLENGKYITSSPTMATPATMTVSTTTERFTTASTSKTTEDVPCDEIPNHSGWFSCPDGDRWACWGSVQIRDALCPGRGYMKHHKIIRNKWGLLCYCCGFCPIYI